MNSDLIIMILSGTFLIVGAFLWQKGNYLMANGKTAKAVIFRNNLSRPDEEDGAYFPVVRFKTDKDEWITQQLDIGYQPAKPVGTKLEVIYDPDDPTSVAIHAAFELEILPRLFVTLGLAGLIFGTLAYLNYITF